MAGEPAVLDPDADSAAEPSSRFEPSDRGAASRQAALRLARDARALPMDVRWFYLRTLRSVIRRDGLNLDDTERPADLVNLLRIAGASRQVVALGGHSALSAISLALSEERRRVTILGPPAQRWELGDYLRYVDPDVRSRIDFHPEPGGQTAETLPAVDLVFVDRSAAFGEMLAAARDAERIVRPGGLAVLRGYRRREVDELLEQLRLEGSALDGSLVDGAFVWRRPPNGKGVPSSGVAKRGVPGFALTGMLVGMAAAVMLPASLSESLPGTSGKDRELLPAQPRTASAAAPNARRGQRGDRSGAPRGGRPPGAPRRDRPSGAPQEPASRLAVGAGAFSGTGNRDLGTLRVDQPVVLRWNADGRPFAIVSQEWRFPAHGRSGTTVLTPGTYRRFAVKSTARWKLQLDSAQ